MVVERRGDLRVLAGTPVEASVTFYQGGVVADPGEDVTVQVRRADGTIFTPDAPVAGTEDAPRTVALSKEETAEIDLLTLRWTSQALGTLTTTVEVVGDRIFTIAELRAFGNDRDGRSRALDNAERYSDAVIDDTRRLVEDGFEEICQVAFIPRFKVSMVDAATAGCILLPAMRTSSVRFVQVRENGTWMDLSNEEIDDLDLTPWGELTRWSGNWPRGRRNIRVGYIHGWDRPPEEIRRAGMILARTQLIEGNVSDRAMGFSDEAGSYRLATAGVTRGSWYGLPLVDSVLQRYCERVPGVG